jgi:hypothetical protein
VESYEFLLSRGYKLRPRYNPEWVPSWGPKRNPISHECDDFLASYNTNALDALCIKDNQKVVLKRVNGKELKIFRHLDALRSDARNHTIPLLDVILLPFVPPSPPLSHRNTASGQPASKKTRSDGTSRTVGAATSTPLSDLTARSIASPPRPRVQPAPVSTVAESTAAVSINQSSTTANVPEPDADADSDAESEAENAETLEEHRQAYRKDKVVVLTKKTRKRKDGNELSPEMDDMINAGAEQRCIKCFRVPGRLYFGSDRTGAFLYLVVGRANFLSSFRP